MMYREFINLTSFGESYITYEMYKEYIEPVYSESSLDKKAFCKRFYNLHNDCVSSMVNTAMISLPQEILEDYIFSGEAPKEVHIIEEIHKHLLSLFLGAVWSGQYNSKLKSTFHYRSTGKRLHNEITELCNK